MQAIPETKVAPTRKIKVATGTKAKAKAGVSKSSTAIKAEAASSEVEVTPAAPSPVTPVIPAYGTMGYFEWRAEERRIRLEKNRIAKKKKLAREDIIFAKDIEDSEDEWPSRKAKKTKTKMKTKQENDEEAVTAARSTGSVYTYFDDMRD